jgi:hypothetical protein
MVKEKIAEPIQDDNEVKVEAAGGVDPAVLVEKQKAKDEKMRSAIESLKTKVGPLSPSEAIAKAAIEQAEYNAIVKHPSKGDSKRKEDERNAESPVPQRQETEEKANAVEETEEKVEQAKAVEEKVTNAKPKKEDADDKEEKEKDESISSIQPAPSSTGDAKEEEEAKKTRSPEEIEADRERQELFGKDKD